MKSLLNSELWSLDVSERGVLATTYLRVIWYETVRKHQLLLFLIIVKLIKSKKIIIVIFLDVINQIADVVLPLRGMKISISTTLLSDLPNKKIYKNRLSCFRGVSCVTREFHILD